MELVILIIKIFFILWSIIVAIAIGIIAVKVYQINRLNEISTIGYLLPREKRAREKAKKLDLKGRWMELKPKLDLKEQDKLQSSLALCESFIIEAINIKGIKGNDLKDLLKEAGFKGFEGVKYLWEAYKTLHLEGKKDSESLKNSLTNYILGIEDMIDFGLMKQ